MVTTVRGQFKEFTGEAVVDTADPAASKVNVKIQASSIDTGVADRDGHLRSADFFEVDRFPTITFESSAVRPTGGEGFELDGTLTIKGISNPVTLQGRFEGWGPGMQEGSTVAAFSAKTTIDREDWDLTWNMAVETGGFLVSKKVDIEIDAELQLVG
jgi:polyisoprenoid-binding protein YceI